MYRWRATTAIGMLLTVLAGCSPPGPTEPASAVLPSSCQIAMLPPAGESKLDRRIGLHQQLAAASGQRAAHLERLGWAYIAEARAGSDEALQLAAATARCIAQETPDSAAADLLLGHVLHQQHRFGEAERIARSLVERRGAWFDHALLGDVLIDRGNVEEAVAAYQRVADQNPGPQAYTRAAHVRWLRGDVRGAAELLRAAIRSTRPDGEASGWLHVRLADLERLAGNDPAAEAMLGQALQAEPDYPPALLGLGRLKLSQGEAAAAVALLAQAAAARPQPEYLWALAEAQRAAGQPEAALETEAALLATGEQQDPRTLVLFLATRRIDADRALRLAEAELSQRRDVLTLDAVSWSLYASGQPMKAMAQLRKALALGTAEPRLYLHAALIAAHAGSAGETAQWLQRAREYRGLLLPSERRLLDELADPRTADPGPTALRR